MTGTAIRGQACLLILAAFLLTLVAAVSGAAWESAIGDYLSGNELVRSDFPAIEITSALPYEFPFIWLALILLIGVLRFVFLYLAGVRGGASTKSRNLEPLKWTLVLAAFSVVPMLVNGLFAAITGNLFPIGVDYNAFEAARVLFAIVGVVLTWIWEGYITVIAYGIVFAQGAGRAVLAFLFPWLVMYFLSFVV